MGKRVGGWLRRWGIRSTLVAAAVIIAGLAVSRALIQETTATTSEVTSQSVSGGTAPSATTTKINKTTTSNTTGSDSLELGLLGTAALFALMAAFYNRLSKVTLPGGIGFELSAAETQKLTRTVADRVGHHVATAPAPRRREATSGWLRAFSYMSASEADPRREETVKESAEQVGRASVLAARYAQELLQLAGSETLLRARAADYGVTDNADIAALMTGSLTDLVRERLADKGLRDAGITS